MNLYYKYIEVILTLRDLVPDITQFETDYLSAVRGDKITGVTKISKYKNIGVGGSSNVRPPAT